MGALSRPAAFWLLAGLLCWLLFAASAPSPLYPIYQELWRFQPAMLTLVYGMYAFGALGALLLTGRISDYVGRRPVASVGLIVQLVAMILFLGARGVEWLLLARLLQGIGTGMATGAISAWLVDLQPPQNPRLASLVTAVALLAGLGSGGLAASVLAEFGPDPLHLVFWILAAVNGLALASMAFLPDPVPRRAGWRTSVKPEIGVPEAARTGFGVAAPSLIAMWAVAGLYLSLGPSLAFTLAASRNAVLGGLLIGALLGVAAIVAVFVRGGAPGALLVRGSAGLVVGGAITTLAVALGSASALYGGAVVAGAGLGSAFLGALRTIIPLAPPERRAALLAATYVVIYLSFSLPAIVAGLAVPVLGLPLTAILYGLASIGLAAVTLAAIARRRSR